MKLEKVTAEIRPRGRWESIDLGCALVRENYGKVLSAWLLIVVPIWFLIIALCQWIPSEEARPWIAGFICVWILPFCDRVPLFVLSRRLFGEDSTWGELLKALPGMFSRRFFMTLLVGPFDLGRGLSQPVMELEGLKRKAYRERVTLLSRNGGEGASQASLISFVLVLSTMFSMLFLFLGLVNLFGDSVVLEEFWVDHVLESDAAFIQSLYVWILVGLILTSISLVEPFYVGAGFAIYINSRTVTEGWDIELAFKRMSERVSGVLQNTGRTLTLLLGSIIMLAPQAEASNERLDEVMAHKDFKVHTEIVEVPVGSYQYRNSVNLEWLGPIAQLVFLGVVVCVAAGLIWLIYSNRHLFTGAKRPKLEKKCEVTRFVMGMEVAPETLPDDIVGAARAAWDAGKRQEALSLLYRGSISFMVHECAVSISDSDTESDCLRVVQKALAGEKSEYFSRLTENWMRLAYGGNEPHPSEASWLMEAWPYQREESV